MPGGVNVNQNPLPQGVFFIYHYLMAILNVDKLTYRLPNGRALYKDFSLELNDSSGILIYGPNGSGKSSLVKILLGLVRHYSGRVEVLGKDIKRLSKAKMTDLRREIGFQMEEPVVFEDMNLMQNISVYLRLSGQKHAKSEIISTLYETGFSGLRNKRLSALSWGEMRMIEILRIMMKSPRLIICDQPFAALDDDTVEWVAEKFRAMVNSGSSVLATFSRPEVRDHLGWPEIDLTR
ncbi:MAG TPA: ATP-binding cassette domain-containing protein [candidate division Zixibacteria bacterium]|nr:ATP-binding cassette domain-containing protein [candidate division Zixibacteria bacterium]